MHGHSEEQLPVGRAAFAKAFCADWISEHSRKILLCCAALPVLAFILFQLLGAFSYSKSDYLEVQKAFGAWSKEENLDHKLFSDLEKLLGRHPGLQEKFGTHIAQRLLVLGDVKKAGIYYSAAQKRSHELISPYYSRFSRNTMTIAQGKFTAALEEAKLLKRDLQKDDAFWEGRNGLMKSGAILYAWNLLRIAALEQQLGSKEGELMAWEELERNAGWMGAPSHPKCYDPEAFALLTRNFTQGDISLPDYIGQRKKELR